MKALVIEDTADLRGMITAHLTGSGYIVDGFGTGEAGLAALAASSYDILLLDLGLPDCNGLDLISKIVVQPGAPPVIVITARDAVTARIAGLDAGADDYLIKPFDLLELEARIHAVLRRPRERRTGKLACGDISLDLVSLEGSVNGRPLDLARREAAMLELLLRADGRTVVRDVLEERLYSFDEPVTPNAIEAVVSRLRRKLELLGAENSIRTQRGIGYRLEHKPHGPS